MFKVEMIGHLGADVEIKESNGSKFAAFRMAHTDKYKAQDGSERESTLWVDVTINNVESKVLPYLLQGVQVFVRGNGRLRVYSSPKLRQMVAGLTISAMEIELIGGRADDVPKQLIEPDTAAITNVTRYYWCDLNTKGMKMDDAKFLQDQRGRLYVMNNQGFVAPYVEEPTQTQEGENVQVNSDSGTK